MTIPLPRLWLSLCLLSLTLSMSGCAQSDPCPDGQGRTADGFCAELLVPCLEGQVRLLNGECVDVSGDDDDSSGDDDDTSGDDDDTSGDDDDTSGDDDDTSGDDDTVGGPDADGDGFVALSAGGSDCDDDDSTVHPGAVELCDGIDNNCNGVVDGDNPGGALPWYPDADADGYGNPQFEVSACEAPEGYVGNADDCDDQAGHSYPGAEEICDDADNDCDDNIDEGVQLTWYQDSDSDGYGNGSSTVADCDAVPGYVDNDSDCDDADATINPSAYELCDSIDNDCDSSVDEDPINGTTWYLDADSDGAGGSILTVQGCSAPIGYVDNQDDCDDLDPAVGPTVGEVCNGSDDDCDGSIDEEATDGITWYLDNDGDGVGGGWLTQQACTVPPGYAADSSDCDDTDATTYPTATELCDGQDNDCDGALGSAELDDDGDGVTDCDGDCDDADPLRFAGSIELCDGIDNDCNPVTIAGDGETDDDGDGALNCDDCDDADAAVSPSAVEICNSLDDDCDGTVDVGATDTSTWYLDADGDGYGGGWLTQVACTGPTGYVANSDDCNDLDSSSYPGGTEVCDGQDNDCDGTADNGASATWYADADGDGYGDPGTVQSSCSAPIGYVSNDLDCDDGEAASNPASFEICDGIDNNCVDGIDEGSALDTTDWYIDADGDGYGVPGTSLAACSQPTGYAANDDDCNDDPSGGAAINPAQTENWYDGIDQDCNGGSDYDQDGDGHDSEDYGGDDCDDTDGTLFSGCPLYGFTSHTFNSCGVSGREGPSLSACLNEYSTSPWTTDINSFNILIQGIQRWTVPASGVYRIEAVGAAGQSNVNSFTGGLGASMRGDFTLTQGEVLQILVGQMGTSNTTHGNENGGGGGSFVITDSNNPLVIAGGGGGAPSTSYGTGCTRNPSRSHAVTSTSGVNFSCQCSSSGGTGGGGGGSCNGSYAGAGGGGFLSAGIDNSGSTHCGTDFGGSSFGGGGVGGQSNSCYSPNAHGGFGGGGAASLSGPGGGGGYSGGASGGDWSSYSDFAGGGGSFNDGNNQTNAVQVGTTDGRVEITPLF